MVISDSGGYNVRAIFQLGERGSFAHSLLA